jgi:hypothetical protein
VEEYQPAHDDGWDDAYSKLSALMERIGIEK